MEYSVANINYNGNNLTIKGLFDTDHIFRHLNIVHNFYELRLLEKIKSLNLKGTYVDVGANIGNHTVFFSKFCESEKVISIELDSQIYDVLNENVNDLKLSNVTTLNIGVGEKYKLVKTSDIDKTNVGMTKIIGEDGDVVVDTLDKILSDVNDVSLIKIDVEGYEKNVLIGASEIIKKHSPIIITELKDDNEFNEFETLANELGYFTDKINYASTPTYFWVKKKDELDYVYIIPSYDRFEKVSSLINEILNTHKNTLVILLNDGCNDERYEYFKTLNNVVYLTNKTNNGKSKYWMTVNTLLSEMSKYTFKYGVMLADDFSLVNNYLIKLESYINQEHIVRLFTQESIGKTNWGFSNWVDGAFCAPYSFFKKINFELFPIVRKSNLSSSGVGQQMSERITKLGLKVKNYGSLINHLGNDDSKMHPKLRTIEPLVASYLSNDKILSIIVPTYNIPHLLNETLTSIIDSIKILNCEILVGIDGCQMTLNYVKENSFDNRIKFFYFENNVGPYIIKNTLSVITKSDYLLFFDSDDIINQQLISDITYLKDKYDLIKPMYLDFQNSINNIDKNIKTSNTYGEGVFAIKKEIFLNFNGFEGWRCAADSDFMGRLYKNNINLKHTTSIGFYRRIHTESLTQKPETNMYSLMRRNYATLSKGKKYHGPLDKLITEPYTELEINTHQYVNETSNDEIKPDYHEDVIKSNVYEKKPRIDSGVNYDELINTIKTINNTYHPSKNITPPSQNIPVNRNELFEIKKGTLAELNRSFNKINRKRF